VNVLPAGVRTWVAKKLGIRSPSLEYLEEWERAKSESFEEMEQSEPLEGVEYIGFMEWAELVAQRAFPYLYYDEEEE
jgi:hypothetical protein